MRRGLNRMMVPLKAAEIKAALFALGDIDGGQNKVLDINSLTSAVEDYLKKAGEARAGVLINYYL